MQYTSEIEPRPTMNRLCPLTATLLLLLPVFTRAQLPNGACYTEDLTCELQNDNLGCHSIHDIIVLSDFLNPSDTSVGFFGQALLIHLGQAMKLY